MALGHTGLARELARFQARSAFSEVGFTTLAIADYTSLLHLSEGYRVKEMKALLSIISRGFYYELTRIASRNFNMI